MYYECVWAVGWRRRKGLKKRLYPFNVKHLHHGDLGPCDFCNAENAMGVLGLSYHACVKCIKNVIAIKSFSAVNTLFMIALISLFQNLWHLKLILWRCATHWSMCGNLKSGIGCKMRNIVEIAHITMLFAFPTNISSFSWYLSLLQPHVCVTSPELAGSQWRLTAQQKHEEVLPQVYLNQIKKLLLLLVKRHKRLVTYFSVFFFWFSAQQLCHLGLQSQNISNNLIQLLKFYIFTTWFDTMFTN